MTMTTPTTETVEKVAREVTERLWPLLGGNHIEAEFWGEIGEAILDGTRAAIAAMPDSTQLLQTGELSELLEFLGANRQTHSNWAAWFEANPDKEAEYVATGEWDDAKEHRRLEAGYSKVIAALGARSQLLQTMAGALERIAATYKVVGSETDDGEVGEKTELSEWEMANIAKATLAQFRAQEQRS